MFNSEYAIIYYNCTAASHIRNNTSFDSGGGGAKQSGL